MMQITFALCIRDSDSEEMLHIHIEKVCGDGYGWMHHYRPDGKVDVRLSVYDDQLCDVFCDLCVFLQQGVIVHMTMLPVHSPGGGK